MNRTDKEALVADLVEELNQAHSLYLTDFTGLTVKSMTELRRRLWGAGLRFRVVKNTLAERAFKEAEVSGMDDLLAGPTGFVVVREDPVQAAKVLADFRKENEDRPAIKAGMVEGRRVTADEIKRLATVPSRPELLGQLALAMQAPIQGLLGCLNAALVEFAGLVEALRQERESAG